MSLSHDEFLNLPVIALRNLENNPDADYNAAQLFLLPYLNQIAAFWWICFAAVLAILIVRFFVMPVLARQNANSSAAIFVTEPPASIRHLPKAENFVGRVKQFYIRIFSILEIENDVALRLYGGALLIGYLISFNRWQMSTASTVAGLADNQAMCWPFFQSCGRWFWFNTLPYGYSQTILFMGLFGLILLTAYGLLARRILIAHVSLLIIFLFKIYFSLIVFYYNANYNYYLTLFTGIFLFLPYKRFFGSLVIIWAYFLSTATKIHPTWVLGTYFSAMREGLPIFPNGTEPFFTNLVIFMEMLMSWFIFSRKVLLQKVIFVFFVIFHLYSGTLVGYEYPSVVTPPLLIFFGPLFRPFPIVPRDKASIGGWSMIALLLAVQMYCHTLPGDPKLTLEGNYYGFYMFEANHQCRVTVKDATGQTVKTLESESARDRCDPWHYLARMQNTYCKDANGSNGTYSLNMIHSINGGPFYQIVDEPDLCHLHYNAFSQNDWLKDENTAQIVGRPKQNYYR